MGKRLAMVAGVVVLLAGLITAANFLWPRELTGRPVAAPAPPTTCENAVSMYFARNDDMRSAEVQLRDHPHIGRIETETREQAAQRLTARFGTLKKFFESPHDYTAALHLTAVGVSKEDLAVELVSEILLGKQAAVPSACHRPASDPFDYISEVSCGKIVIWFDSQRSRSATAQQVLRFEPLVRETIEQAHAELIPESGTVTGDEPTLDVFTEHGANLPRMADEMADLPGAVAAEPAHCVAMPHPALDGGPA